MKLERISWLTGVFAIVNFVFGLWGLHVHNGRVHLFSFAVALWCAFVTGFIVMRLQQIAVMQQDSDELRRRRGE